MRYKISKSFKKQVSKIKDQKILAKVRSTIEEIGDAASLQEIHNLEPLKDFPNDYRIKFDYRYRIGVYCDSDVVAIA